MSTNTSGGAITRRQAITATAAVAIIPTNLAPIDPHHAWLEEWRVLNDEFYRLHDPGSLVQRLNKLADLIAFTPAQTANGIKAKLRFLREDNLIYLVERIDLRPMCAVFDNIEGFLR